MEEIKFNMENLTEEEKKQLLDLVDKANNVSKVWKPKFGEKYWYIVSTGTSFPIHWIDSPIDNDMWEIGNCFKTREEAECRKKQLEVEAKLKRFAEEYNEPIDWCHSSKSKFSIVYIHSRKRICSYEHIWNNGAEVYFSSKEICKKAIAEIGEEDLKIYLGVKE